MGLIVESIVNGERPTQTGERHSADFRSLLFFSKECDALAGKGPRYSDKSTDSNAFLGYKRPPSPRCGFLSLEFVPMTKSNAMPTLEELISVLLPILPDAEVGQNSDGQIVIYTGLTMPDTPA